MLPLFLSTTRGFTIFSYSLPFFSAIGAKIIKPNSTRLPIFLLVIGLFQSTGSSISFALQEFPFLPPSIYAFLQTSFFIHIFLVAMKPNLRRSFFFRLFLTWPSMFFTAASFLSLTTLILPFAQITFRGSFAMKHLLPGVFFALSSIGMYQSFVHPPLKVIHIDTRRSRPGFSSLSTLKRESNLPQSAPSSSRSLNIFQITDPHLGQSMSIDRLRRVCQQAVSLFQSGQIDFVFLTGDYLTVDSHGDHDNDALSIALSPLKELKGKTFACLGNHDYERLNVVKQALLDNEILLLVDEEVLVQSPIGKIQIIGSKFKFGRGRLDQEHIQSLCAKFPKRVKENGEMMPRVFLVHNPLVFGSMPLDDRSIVFSGHMHGGQLGFISLGLELTIVSLYSKLFRMKPMPDHGLWRSGENFCYVHAGTGHYGFPLRIGVPSEISVLRVWFD